VRRRSIARQFLPMEGFGGLGMRRFLPLALVASLLSAIPAAGQTTQPAGDSWATTVSAFARSLADSDPAAVLPWLDDNVAVQAFDAKTADAVRLLARVRGGTLITTQAYTQAPASMASDVAAAFRSAAVPDEIKLRMIPQSEGQMLRANQIAGQWLAESLVAKREDLVGAIVFCCAHGTPGATGSPAPEIVFVLVKGSAAEADHPRIQRIMFGDPVKQVR
jgi:hypothetical protein